MEGRASLSETPCWAPAPPPPLPRHQAALGPSPPCHHRPQECPCGPGQGHCLVTVNSLPPHLTCSLSLSDSASVQLYDLVSLPSLIFCAPLSQSSQPAQGQREPPSLCVVALGSAPGCQPRAACSCWESPHLNPPPPLGRWLR